MRLGLGTVQFGLDYGVSNRSGKTPLIEARRVVEAAMRAGIRTVDTAPHYGDSEVILGEVLPRDIPIDIVTKVPRFGKVPLTAADTRELRNGVETSLMRLRRTSVYGLMFHCAQDLLNPGGDNLFQEAQEQVDRGLVERVGVSFYSREEIEQVTERYPIRLAQIPLNILDQRLLKSGTLSELHRAGIELHVRSAFLQGLIFMDPAKLDPYFEPARLVLERLRSAVNDQGITQAAAALGFLRAISEIDKIIIGVNTVSQLESNLEAYEAGEALDFDYSAYSIDNEHILNPSLWRFHSNK